MRMPLIALLLTACGPAPDGGNRWPDVGQSFVDYVGDGTEEGKYIPAFTSVDQFGDTVDSRQFLGNVTVIDLGAVWCTPCQEAAATQQALANGLASEGVVTVVSVLLQEGSGGPPDSGDAAEWADVFGLTIPVLADERAELVSGWSVEQWPTVIVVAPDGEVLKRFDGDVSDTQIIDAVHDAWQNQ